MRQDICVDNTCVDITCRPGWACLTLLLCAVYILLSESARRIANIGQPARFALWMVSRVRDSGGWCKFSKYMSPNACSLLCMQRKSRVSKNGINAWQMSMAIRMKGHIRAALLRQKRWWNCWVFLDNPKSISSSLPKPGDFVPQYQTEDFTLVNIVVTVNLNPSCRPRLHTDKVNESFESVHTWY